LIPFIDDQRGDKLELIPHYQPPIKKAEIPVTGISAFLFLLFS